MVFDFACPGVSEAVDIHEIVMVFSNMFWGREIHGKQIPGNHTSG
jgi:hypothetical protein